MRPRLQPLSIHPRTLPRGVWVNVGAASTSAVRTTTTAASRRAANTAATKAPTGTAETAASTTNPTRTTCAPQRDVGTS